MIITIKEYAARVAEVRNIQLRYQFAHNQRLVQDKRRLEAELDEITKAILSAEAEPTTPGPHAWDIPADVEPNPADSKDIGPEFIA